MRLRHLSSLLTDRVEATEIDPMDSELTYAWVIGVASAPLLELAKSAAQYPHIPPGADFHGYDSSTIQLDQGYG